MSDWESLLIERDVASEEPNDSGDPTEQPLARPEAESVITLDEQAEAGAAEPSAR